MCVCVLFGQALVRNKCLGFILWWDAIRNSRFSFQSLACSTYAVGFPQTTKATWSAVWWQAMGSRDRPGTPRMFKQQLWSCWGAWNWMLEFFPRALPSVALRQKNFWVCHGLSRSGECHNLSQYIAISVGSLENDDHPWRLGELYFQVVFRVGFMFDC